MAACGEAAPSEAVQVDGCFWPSFRLEPHSVTGRLTGRGYLSELHAVRLFVKLLALFVETAIRSIIFIVPTIFVAKWCDVPLTSKSAVFMMFCIVWSDCVLGAKEGSAKQDDPPAAEKRKVTAVLTPAEVAAEARKLTR
jgi:hypothetical protein